MSKTEYFLLFYMKWPLAMLFLLCAGQFAACRRYACADTDRTKLCCFGRGRDKEKSREAFWPHRAGGFGIKQENQMTLASAWSYVLNLDSIQETKRDGWREREEQKSRPMAVVNFHMNGRFNISLGKGSSRRLGRCPEVQSSLVHPHAEEGTHTQSKIHTHTHTVFL